MPIRDSSPIVTREWKAWEWLLLLAAPPLAWAGFGVVLINQDNFLDPWFYLGYGRAFTVLQSMFGWPYYAVRFPVIMLNGVFVSGEHPMAGYAVLRYLMLLVCAVPLYAWSRRACGRPAAILSYLFLLCCPLLPRILLWDLTTFVSVPMALAGMATWLLSERVPMRVLSGALLMAAVASHAYTGTAVGTFLLIQAVRRTRTGAFRRLLLTDIAATALGAAASGVTGFLYYYARVGPIPLRTLIDPTLAVIRAGDTYASVHGTPFATWAAREYHAYVPAFCVFALGVLLGRRILQNTAAASVWWFGLAYTLVYGAYQFLLGRFVLEMFYYFAHLTIVVFLLVPLIVFELTRLARRTPEVTGFAAGTGALVAIPIVHHLRPAMIERAQAIFAGNTVALLLLLAACAVFSMAAPVLRRRHTWAGIAGFFLLVQVFTFLSPVHSRVFDQRHRARERGVYRAAVQMLDVFRAYSTASTPVMLWWCSRQFSMQSIASTVLLYAVHSVNTPDGCLARIGEYERAQLATKPRYIMLLDEAPSAFLAQESALRREGFLLVPRVTATIGDDGYRASLRLVEISREAP